MEEGRRDKGEGRSSSSEPDEPRTTRGVICPLSDGRALEPNAGAGRQDARVLLVDDESHVRPTQLSTQCVDNLPVRKHLGESDHVEQIRARETVTELSRQLVGKGLDYALAVLGTSGADDFATQTIANLPIQHYESGVDALRNSAAGSFDERANLGVETPGTCPNAFLHPSAIIFSPAWC